MADDRQVPLAVEALAELLDDGDGDADLELAAVMDVGERVEPDVRDGAEPVAQELPTPRPCAMPLQRSSRFCPDWWMTQSTLVAPSCLKRAPEAWKV